MFSVSFITSYLTFYLRSKVLIEGEFFKIYNPKTFLKTIPLGRNKSTISVNKISSVNTSFGLDFLALLWGLAIGAGVYLYIKNYDADCTLWKWELVFWVYALLTMLSSFQIKLKMHTLSGEVFSVNAIIFSKAKVENLLSTIQSLIKRNTDDKNTDVAEKIDNPDTTAAEPNQDIS